MLVAAEPAGFQSELCPLQLGQEVTSVKVSPLPPPPAQPPTWALRHTASALVGTQRCWGPREME